MGGAAPQGSLDVLMSEFSGGTCVGRDARRCKYVLICYLNLFGDIEDVYAHFHIMHLWAMWVCSDVAIPLLYC